MKSLSSRKFPCLERSRRLAAAALLSSASALVLAPGSTAQPAPQNSTVQGVGAVPYIPAKSIDFSSKHNIMIRNEDGTLTPMDVPYYRSKLIAPGTWQIESDGDYQYLIEGDNEALAIDSGYGAGNIRAYMQTLTNKPVRYVANTHYHFDHTANDGYFDRAYMSAGTAEKATVPYPSFEGVNFPKDYPKVIIGDGYKFQLGNREIEVFLVGNHTKEGTAFLDKKSRILFSGDEIMEPNEPINVSVAQFAANMRKLEARRSEYDRLAGGPGIFDATDVDKYLAAAESVLAGNEGEIPASPRRPAATPADPSAPMVYGRRSVRAPDRPPGMGAANENMRRMVYQDRQITYDIRHIQN